MVTDSIKIISLSVLVAMGNNVGVAEQACKKRPNILFCIADDASLLGHTE